MGIGRSLLPARAAWHRRWRSTAGLAVFALVAWAVPAAAQPAPRNQDAEAAAAEDAEPSRTQAESAPEAGSDDEGASAGVMSATASSAIIDNGTIQLGVHPQGHLNVPGGTPSSGTGTTYVGLRYLPTGAEATAPGCLCEGWGAADSLSGVTGYANESTDGVHNLTTLDFQTSERSARSVVDVGTTLRVTHSYEPSATPHLYEVTVNIQNISDADVDARYRRVMDWDIEPTAFSEFVTARTGGSPLLLGNTNDGFETANPLGGRGTIGGYTGDFTDVGPMDHGALFDFGFGRLEPGQIKTFRIYYGAAGTETDALTAIADVQAPVYSLGQPNTPDGPTVGTPNTFIFAFGDLGLTSGPITPREAYGAGNPAWAHDPQCHTGRPINCATGNFWHTFLDLTVPGRGPGLLLDRTYNALDAATDGPFGHGWSSTLTMGLTVNADGTVEVRQENGSLAEFTPTSAGDFRTRPRLQATLAETEDGYTFVRHEREIFEFAPDGRLREQRDTNGDVTSYGYDGSGRLTTVTDAAGRRLTLGHDTSGRIASATDPAGRTVIFGYDDAGNLTSVTDVAGGVTTFGYDDDHRMTTWTDPRGGETTNRYDDAGRVIEQVDPTGAPTALAYTDTTTTITGPDGGVQLHEYLDGILTQLTKGVGSPAEATWSYTYDPDTLGRTAVTDPNGHTVERTFDERGNTRTITDALGNEARFTYGPRNELTSAVDANGNVTELTYDPAGNLLEASRVVSEAGDVSRQLFTYDDPSNPGDVTSVTDPTGRRWTFGYDANGDLEQITDPAGQVTRHRYDVLGRRSATVMPRGNEPGADPTDHTITFEYDEFGDPIAVVDPLGGELRRRYDRNRNLVELTDADGDRTAYVYDAGDRLVETRRADGSTIGSAYDAAGNLASRTDAAGQTSTYEYDALGRPTAMFDPAGRVWRYGYDAAGRATTTTDPEGNVTTQVYDAGDRLIATRYSDPDTPDVTYAYDAGGRRTSMADGTGTSTYEYDGLDRVVAVHAPGGAVAYGYDLAGRTTSLTYPNGEVVTHGHDAVGRLATVSDWLGGTTSFDYDADGNLTAVAYPNGVVATATFDAADRLSSLSHAADDGSTLAAFDYDRSPGGQLTATDTTGLDVPAEAYGYSPLDQLTSVNDLTYGYDAADNIVALTNGTTLAYGTASQLSSTTGPDGDITTFEFDARGNRVGAASEDGERVSYEYDQANRLVAVTGAGAPAPGAMQLAAGQTHSMALRPDGAVWTWGQNSYGQLGDGTSTSRSAPVEVPGLRGKRIAAGALHSLAVTEDGTVSAWGYNAYGQLGDGTSTASSVPTGVDGLADVADVAAGNYHSLAVGLDGSAWAWGSNATGQLGDGTVTASSSPVQVSGLTDVTAVAGGGLPGWSGHSLALTADGTVWSWGYNRSGQLGDGSKNHRLQPVQVEGLTEVVAVAAGGDSSYALKADGTVWAWGDNSYGQLGNAQAKRISVVPVRVDIDDVETIAAGGTHALTTLTDGTSWSWGNDNTGQLGDGGGGPGDPKTTSTPVQVTGLQDVSAVAGGYVHSIAATSDGDLWGWGNNTHGQVGDGTTTVRSTPVAVSGPTGTSSTSSAMTTQESSYTYDGNGLRVAKSVGSRTTTFVWDVSQLVPQLLVDGDRSIIYGPAGVPLQQIADDGSAVHFHQDQLGSTRLLTDETGAAVATYSYDAYGAVTSTTGTADTALRFAGEYADAETGLVYLRARYYDPETAQFITRDPIEATTGSAYGYVGGNPLNLVDPMGLCGWRDPWNCVKDAAGAVGGFVVEHRHTIIDVGITVGGATAATACVLSVACGIGVGIAAVGGVAVVGAGAHWGSDRIFDDGRNISGGEIAFRSGFSAAAGGVCGLIFLQGCAIAAGGLRPPVASWAVGPLSKLFQTAVAASRGRLLAGLFLVNNMILKTGLTRVLFARDDC